VTRDQCGPFRAVDLWRIGRRSPLGFPRPAGRNKSNAANRFTNFSFRRDIRRSACGLALIVEATDQAVPLGPGRSGRARTIIAAVASDAGLIDATG